MAKSIKIAVSALIALFTCALCALALVACGNNSGSTNPDIVQTSYWDDSNKLSIAPAGETYESVALMWDKDSGEYPTYEIYQDGQKIDSTDKLYYVAENLKAETSYKFEVKADGKSIGTVDAKTSKKDKVLTILELGAVADGTTKNTQAIQRAIDACPENGTVLVPQGTFLTGALDLKNNMTLYLSEGATLKGSTDANDYLDANGNMVLSRFEGWELQCYRSLINVGKTDHNAAYTTQNVNIRGKGTICGGGAALGEVTGGLKNKIQEERDSTRKRGRLISFNNSQNVNLSGVTVTQPPCWTIHAVYSDRVSCYDLTISTSGIANGDGMDPDSSTNMAIFGCKFATGDDCVAIKSGKNPEGNEVNRPTKFIRIQSCEILRPEGLDCSGWGLAIGSEMSGGVEDVRITDTDIVGTRFGVEVKTPAARGGYVKGLYVKDCKLDGVYIHNSGINYNDDGESASSVPVLEDFRFEGVQISGYDYQKKEVRDAIYIEGFEGQQNYVKNILLKNVIVGPPSTNVVFKYCSDIKRENVKTADGGEPKYTFNHCENY